MMQTLRNRNHLLAGAKAAIPPGFGCIPVGLSIGMLAGQAGMSKLEGILMSVLVMAGASELMAIGMLTAGASVAAIILGTFFLNLRHCNERLSMADHGADAPGPEAGRILRSV